MGIIDRIDVFLKKKGITGAKMSRDLDFSSGLYSQWKKGIQQPSNEKLHSIADYLGISVDYLLGRTNDPHAIIAGQLEIDKFSGDTSHLTELAASEKDLINKFRILPLDNKKRIHAIVDYDYQKCVKELNRKEAHDNAET